MVARAAALGLSMMVATAGTCPACFDVRTVDPGPYVIDDFDDGDFEPSDPIFESWNCYNFNPPDKTLINGCLRGGDSNDRAFSMYVDATVVDPADGIQQHGGAGIVTRAKRPEDFSSFTRLVFSLRLESRDPPLPIGSKSYVELGCSTATSGGGATPGNLYVLHVVTPSDSWQQVSLGLDNFGGPSWLVNEIDGGFPACLRVVDGIRFTFEASLPDGASGRGVLSVDDIHFQ